ncbi:MAG: glycosyltransferase family 2 protein [Kiritimatiellae bacterium]|nr:glycosyltransferase family 2 protein [Kiritimatiellia bacterium]
MTWALTILGFMFFWSTFVVFSGLAVGLVRRRAKGLKTFDENAAQTRFACVICAHNEERVIFRPIASVLAADYPERLREIVVFADNCSDRTAEIAASFPGVKVMEKKIPSGGKGDVLAWGLDIIRNGGYDAIAVFDADHEVDPAWFRKMDRAIRNGAQVATGYRMSSNPFANLITGWYTLYWNLMNELSNRVRSNLNLSSMLTGTGFCFKPDVLPEGGWRTRTFVEDLEFAFFCNLDGHRVCYVPDAVFYDEQPVAVRPMFRQLNRWATGGLQILRFYVWRWLKALFRGPSFRLFDCFAIITLGVCGSLLLFLNAAALNWRFGLWFLAFAWASAVLSTALSRHSIRALLLPIVTFPVFAAILSCTVVYSMFFPQRSWKPIEHGR